MKSRISLMIAISMAVSGMSSVIAQDNYTAPRTEWGQPDLQGVWNFSSDTPMARPARFGDRQFLTEEEETALAARMAAEAARGAENTADAAAASRGAPEASANPGGYNDFWVEQAGIGGRTRTSHIVYPLNGQLPARIEGVVSQFGGLGPDTPGTQPVRFTVGGIAKDGPEDRGLSERCIIGFNSGPPFAPSMYNNNLQIFQNKDHAVLMTEMIHDARIVPLDRDHLVDDVRQWTGDSRGHWEGETLVVVTRNFNGLTTSYSGFGTSDNKLLTERFTRVNPYTVNYEWTVEDPTTFTDSISAIVPMTKVAGQLYEYGCHEGNYGMVNILRGERMEEKRAVEAENSN